MPHQFTQRAVCILSSGPERISEALADGGDVNAAYLSVHHAILSALKANANGRCASETPIAL